MPMEMFHQELFTVHGHLINNINMMLDAHRQNHNDMCDDEVLADLISLLLMAYGSDVAESVLCALVYRFDMDKPIDAE